MLPSGSLKQASLYNGGITLGRRLSTVGWFSSGVGFDSSLV